MHERLTNARALGQSAHHRCGFHEIGSRADDVENLNAHVSLKIIDQMVLLRTHLEYLASGMSRQEILDDFPYLTEEDIRTCLAYAADGAD
jgi:hypothetical protein